MAPKATCHLEAISNGLGSQSMGTLILAAKGEIPASVSLTANTGAEIDRLWSTGERTTAREYFERVVLPYCSKYGIVAKFIDALDVHGSPLPDLLTHVKQCAEIGKEPNIPMFGSRGGRLRQVCTDKWKVRAIRQEARRMGATSLITAQGIHHGEAWRRISGKFVGTSAIYGDVYQDEIIRKGVRTPVKWCQHYYPLAQRRWNRERVISLVKQEGLPYIITSECDHCPHQDLARWERHTPETLVQIAGIESMFHGQFFFTDERIPLIEALAAKRQRVAEAPELDFGCENSYCGV